MEQKEKAKKSKSSFQGIEFVIWLFISLLYQLEGIIYSLRRSNGLADFMYTYINEFSFKLVIGIVLLLFPIIFKSIFNFYPLSLLKTLLNERLADNNSQIPISSNDIIDKYETNNPLETLKILCKESEIIANNIYSRSNLYLLVGTLIAISGILFFSFQSSAYSVENFNYTSEDIARFEDLMKSIQHQTPTEEVDQANIENLVEKYFFDNLDRKNTAGYTNYLLAFIPRFGALFFIEFIAFFFLKQYRNSMDEFKYYESVKRNRQEILFKINFFESKTELLEIKDLKEVLAFSINPDILDANQTSELIEKRKLSKDEIGIMDKIVDSIVKLKG